MDDIENEAGMGLGDDELESDLEKVPGEEDDDELDDELEM